MSTVTIATEGDTDSIVARRLVEHCGLKLGFVYVAGGKAALDRQLEAYNRAANWAKWLVLRDLDHDAACASELLASILPVRTAHLALRIPVRAVEAWLLGDREATAGYFHVRPALVPTDPEALADPKRSLVDMTRQSRRKAIREDMVPARGMSSVVGVGYTWRIGDFARHHWRPDVAATLCPSLMRCQQALGQWQAGD